MHAWTIDDTVAYALKSHGAISHTPKQIHEIKDFLRTTRRKDVRYVKIKRSKDVVKFKGSSYYTSEFMVQVLNTVTTTTIDILSNSWLSMLDYWK
ncbi:hypothetical protein L6452_19785 [Arctium lappa]|uniref:Uncharacterized protein n=1 Tax=Arctium lappa TaxID=4217 RepID=A0ACB9BDY1_ARCLA|nr:hypothetical protein L6452_19785 [Arctium lappa]